MTSPAELTYFTVTGHYYDVEATLPAGTTNTPQTQYISAYVTFTPRLPPGTLLYVADLDTSTIDPNNVAHANAAIALAPITARILEGELQVINRDDTPDVQPPPTPPPATTPAHPSPPSSTTSPSTTPPTPGKSRKSATSPSPPPPTAPPPDPW